MAGIASTPPRVLLDIVEQHAEEAAFLWHLRDRAVDAPHYAPRHLARLEERVEAHLDGLRVAGEAGFEVAMAQLDRFREPAEAFPVTALALESGEPARLEPVLEIARALPETRRGVFGAIGWVGPTALQPWAKGWLADADPLGHLLGTVACSLHRVDPGVRLAALLVDEDPLVRARACRLAGELGRVDLRDAVAAQPGHWAVWAAALLGDPLAIDALPLQAAEHDPSLEAAARLLTPAAASDWVRALNGNPANRRLVIRALGALGDPTAIPWLVGRMTDPDLARLAGESLALITGADLALLDLEGAAAGGADAGPTDAPADALLDADPDEHLPWPDPAKVAAWWEPRAGGFAKGSRYLLGKRIDPVAVEAALAEGFQRQRRAGAYELAAMRAETSLPTWRRRVGRSAPA